MSTEQNHSLEERILVLEQLVATQQQALQDFQQQAVGTIAQQIEMLFKNEILVDSMAARFFGAAQNAIAFKANHSQQRAGELVVLEAYIPGSMKASFSEDGVLSLEQQLKGSTGPGEGWESSLEEFDKRGLTDGFKELMAAYGAEANRIYYITDTVNQQKHRQLMSRQLASEVTAPVAEEPSTKEMVISLIASDDTAETVEPIQHPAGAAVMVRNDDGTKVERLVSELKIGDEIAVNRHGQVSWNTVTDVSAVQ